MPLKAKDRVIAHSDIKNQGKTIVKRGDRGVVVSANGSWGKSYVVAFVPSEAADGYPVLVEAVAEDQITPG
ncbi:nitrogen fixation protein NifZ [Arthrobacter sp. NicSoilC5]|uniref:nitrogen fixation protein NifZ n=1 Tax=Arthrobacter sp. NicSoilC5 TaxID=2831000 RepID=UPI001CC49D23|nr:nitrogen fixation protein NifZ [Arthrobacter sp. NicSoilC5]BCW78873.1 hypothetical protein NicSoilC5_08920 [Arthrobacter sp. NicSoilC5]